jgi:hypothetical protein
MEKAWKIFLYAIILITGILYISNKVDFESFVYIGILMLGAMVLSNKSDD